ncbi:TetR/AcrR family transcriptional regulator [Nocardia miyunensis]|uniref:TetR/AcrR family transcriptional regulator n=1 Tax=Nocardia miyunensis TaxID=282684 RepID=UPI000830A5DE|nr:TetR/AcrR family transcriptional regulator [Nocardia miyunensis]
MAEDASTTGARVRNRRGEGGRLREEIVTAAAEMLDETGDPSVITLRSIARRVGIAAPSIYRHFPDQSAIILEVLRNAFAELDEWLRVAMDAAGDTPREQLLALCQGYLEYASEHPGRYLIMFGGTWLPNLNETAVTAEDLATLGQATMRRLTEALESCVNAGCSTSTDTFADMVALWIGLHGLAHQRLSTQAFPWPPDIAERIITPLAHLTEE